MQDNGHAQERDKFPISSSGHSFCVFDNVGWLSVYDCSRQHSGSGCCQKSYSDDDYRHAVFLIHLCNTQLANTGGVALVKAKQKNLKTVVALFVFAATFSSLLLVSESKVNAETRTRKVTCSDGTKVDATAAKSTFTTDDFVNACGDRGYSVKRECSNTEACAQRAENCQTKNGTWSDADKTCTYKPAAGASSGGTGAAGFGPDGSESGDAGPSDNTTIKPPEKTASQEASACPDSIFGIPTWYKYLQKENIGGRCSPKISSAQDTLPIGLAVLEMLLRLGGLVAVVFVVVGGVKYVISQGEGEAIAKAKSTITNAIVGLVLVMIAVPIISFMGKKFGGS